MGQKVHPIGIRVGINKTWDSKWFAGRRDYAKTLHQDLAIKKLIMERLKEAGVSQIEIQRNANQVTLNIHVARPGLAIGSQGAAIDNLRKTLEGKFRDKFNINIKEIKKPYQNAYIIAELIGKQIEKRIPYRRACKMAIERAMESGAKGIKINVAGRLNGVEIARSEFFADGKIPLQTFRSGIDYVYYRAVTTYGTIGVKVWIYYGEIFN
ncbi:30S ribosomal protein S3 [Candidatus Peregrinibacteria bacterium]|nr:30S ribosomal protein S3 [Candidatus Peregrinibacteria bacterium]